MNLDFLPLTTNAFIVEGNSDKKALEKIFQKIYNHKDIVFKFMGGDITSDENVDKSNVEDIIYEKVDEYRKYKKLYNKLKDRFKNQTEEK